ncbi:MAG: hypothetical protein ACHQAV_00485 [Solirubrobacterales bacterium]
MIGGLLLSGASAQAALVHPYLSQLTGPPGEPFTGLVCGVNVDPASGEVYVPDLGALGKGEVEQPAFDVFSAAGAFINKIDKGAEAEFRYHEACSSSVNDTTHNIYIANPGEGEDTKEAPLAEDEKEVVFVYTPNLGKYKFQRKLTIDGSGTPTKSFEVPTSLGGLEAGGPLHVAVAQPSGRLFVSVALQGVIDEFSASGEYLSQRILPTRAEPQSVATDSSGNLYAVVELSEEGNKVTVIDEFNVAGVLVKQITGTSSGGFGRLTGVAVDSAGRIYASDGEGLAVDEFDSAGDFMGKMTGAGSPAGAFAEPTGVAVNGEGNVYVADRTASSRPESPGVVDVFAPATLGAPPFLEGESVSNVKSTEATLEARIDPTGTETTYHFEYAPEGGSLASLPEASVGAGESIQSVSDELQKLSPSTTYQYRVVVQAEGHAAEDGPLATFTTLPEGVMSGLPDGRAWELVSPPNKHGALIKGIGGFGVVQAAADGTRISYSATSPIESNPESNAGDAPVLSVRGGGTWSSREIIPPDYPQTQIAGIGTDGLENVIFSSDLSSSLVDPFKEEPLLSPDASERTPYLRNLNDVACLITQKTCYKPLVTAKGESPNVPASEPPIKFGGPKAGASSLFGEVRVAGATPDLSHVVLNSRVPLTTEFNKHPLEGRGLYEWAAGRLQLVSVLPSGEAASGKEVPSLGIRKNGKENVRNAVSSSPASSSGSRIVWSTESPKHLYVRDAIKGETIRLDTVQGGSGEGIDNPAFQTANASGSMVFFTDAQRLTSDSTASAGKPDLYVCQLTPQTDEEGPSGGSLGCTLTDLTGTGVLKSPGESAFVQALLPGASEDGTTVYFVADGVLSSAENAQKEKATPGSCGEYPPLGATCNLYVRHYNGTTWEEPTFIAALSSDDGPDWGALAIGGERLENGNAILLRELTSRVSPNGEYMAFMSDRRLTGFNNTDASRGAGGVADEEVFLYSVSTNRVVCASCNRFGQRPHGAFDSEINGSGVGGLIVDRQKDWHGRWLAANIPGWTEWSGEVAFYQSRYLSDNGRLFFDSADALVPTDTNQTEDVYQYEPNGVGGCASTSGCVGLISSGQSQEESAFLDASETGNDVFFLTASKLAAQDVDQSIDVYDAHECKSESPCLAPPPPSPPPCASSTSCQGASSQQTGSGTPASATLSASGNIVESQGVLPAKAVKLTRAQQLSKALKACRKLKHKKKRVACERSARKRYGPKKASKSSRRARRAGK